jgi:hypothetical protein
MDIDQLKPNLVLRGALFPEPVQVITTIPLGQSVKLIGQGLRTNQVYQSILTPEQLSLLEASPETEPFDGDAKKFRLGVEALRLGLAYEYDPYFSLSIARVDPLPHQTRGGLRLFHASPSYPVPSRRRPRGKKDHHGGSAHKGTEDPGPNSTHLGPHASQSNVSVATGVEG